MEFTYGDRVKRTSNITGFYNGVAVGETGTFKGVYPDDRNYVAVEWDNPPQNYDGGDCDGMCSHSNGCWMKSEDLTLLSQENSILENKMEKKVYRVLVVDKKTGEATKNVVVAAESEQSAILKAFGCDGENAFLKTELLGSYIEDKPINAVIVKQEK